MAQAEGGLPFVHTGAEQLELEDRLDLADPGRDVGANAQPALTHACERVVVFAKLTRERRQPGEPQRVVPVRIDRPEVVADVEHREPVNLEARLGVGRGDGDGDSWRLLLAAG